MAHLDYTPAAVYTHPEVAMCGLTEEDARAKYGDVLVGKSSFAGNGRAIASNEAHGFVKVVADAKYHEILGVHIIGPAAAELINEASTIMDSFSKYVSKGFIHVFREGWVTVDRLQEFIYSQFIFHNC